MGGQRINGVGQLDIASFFTSNNRYIQSYVNNSMTYQFANHRDVEYRHGNLSDNELLSLAKEHLRSCDYVAFYETMFSDFYRMRYELFGNSLNVDAFTYYIYEIGILFAWFRMRTMKYSNALSVDELRNVENMNDLDMQLWDWALQEFDKDFIMFDSYAQASLYIICILFVVQIFIGLTCLWFKCCLFRPKLNSDLND